MSVTYRGGIAYGVYISADDLSEALDRIAEQKIKDSYAEGRTIADYEDFFGDNYENIKENIKEELYDDEILINLDYYCDSAGYILGYDLESVEWGAKPFDLHVTGIELLNIENKITKWCQKLFPNKKMPEMQLLLYSQLC